MQTLTCPICSENLAELTIEGEAALGCPARHGVWFEHGQLARITEDDRDEADVAREQAAWAASDDDPDGMVTERFRSCPVCRRTLHKDNWKYGSGVVVDSCREHGVWVDAGEVERIEAWAEAWQNLVSG